MDEERGTNKGIGFVTFKHAEDCDKVFEDKFVKVDVWEFPVERATKSKKMLDNEQERRN